jgi:hypothetical protein
MSCDTCKDSCGHNACDCACCGACDDAVGVLEAPTNRSGRNLVDARLGDYRRFFSQALGKLSGAEAGALSVLGTREPDDPTVSLIDAWAVAADVLTFYRERFTQEGYLRTACSERSLRELAAQVGYRPRPGVAATVSLAYLLDKGATPVTIPAGAKCQSVPRPGEQMQTFETTESLEARAEWSKLAPQVTRVPGISRADALLRSSLTLQGVTMTVRPGERVLFVFAERTGMQVTREVAASMVDSVRGVTVVQLKPRPGLDIRLAGKLVDLLDAIAKDDKSPQTTRAMASYLLGGSGQDCLAMLGREGERAAVKQVRDLFDQLGKQTRAAAVPTRAAGIDDVLAALGTQRHAQLSSARNLQTRLLSAMDGQGAQRGALLRALSPELGEKLYQVWRSLPATARDPETDSPSIHLLRATHGAYAPSSPGQVKGHGVIEPWTIDAQDTQDGYLYLDSVNDMIVPDSYALVESPVDVSDDSAQRMIEFARIGSAKVVSRSSYGFPVKVSRIELAAGLDMSSSKRDIDVQVLGNRIYSVQSEAVTLAGEAIDDDLAGDTVALDGLYEDLRPGRWIIVAGERADVVVQAAPAAEKDDSAALAPVQGLHDAELVLVAAVDQVVDIASPGSARLTVLTLDKSLAYRYRRATVTIYGNVVKATHGETVNEVLGAGDARVGNQQFGLKRPPLTFVPAISTSGVAGTQIVRVNQTRWREVESLLDAGAEDRVYQIQSGADGVAVLTFGDGTHGARLPSGQENTRATYRTGLGKPGNVQAEQISLLGTRPLGVQGVINPLRASGGAERDGVEAIRSGIPLAVRALSPRSRLVSVEDHAVFARRFAAIGDALATRLLDGGRGWVHVTVVGADDLALDADGPLMAALKQSFRQYGDPALSVVLDVRERLALLIQARVAIREDADWDVVEPKLRARVLDTFSAARRGLGRAAYASEVVAAMHRVAEVAWVDLDVFGALSEPVLGNAGLLSAAVAGLQAQGVQDRVACLPARLAETSGDQRFLPAQMAFLVPDAPATLVLNLVPGGQP